MVRWGIRRKVAWMGHSPIQKSLATSANTGQILINAGQKESLH